MLLIHEFATFWVEEGELLIHGGCLFMAVYGISINTKGGLLCTTYMV